MALRPDTARRIDQLVAEVQSSGWAPSLIAAVARDGELAHVAVAGQTPSPGRDLQYRIGSITKTFTAALVLQLRDAGRLGLDDPVVGHLPDTPLGPLTIRQLLAHVSGLQREPDGLWWERSPGGSVDALLAGLTADKRALPPQRRHHYSNLAYGLLGAVVSRITGRPWRELLREKVLDPLGMRRTTYAAAEPFARGYVVHPWHQTLREEPAYDAGAMAPAGQLWSTVEDLCRWGAFLARPDDSVLPASTVDEMCTPVAMIDHESWTAAAGLGLELARRGDRVFCGHNGSMPGYLACLVAHRPSATVAVVFANSYTMRGQRIGLVGLDVLSTVLEAEPVAPDPWRPRPQPAATVAELTGRWLWMGIEVEASTDATGRGLAVTPVAGPRAERWDFVPDGPDRWRCTTGSNAGEVLRVERGPDGTVDRLDIATFLFSRRPERD